MNSVFLEKMTKLHGENRDLQFLSDSQIFRPYHSITLYSAKIELSNLFKREFLYYMIEGKFLN